MAKSSIERPLNQFDQVKTDNVRVNLDKHISTFNGELDANNMPVESVSPAKLDLGRVKQADLSGTITKWSSSFPTQAYFHTEANNKTFSTNIYTPIFSVDLDVATWSQGFNKLSLLNSTWQDFPLNFDAREGMLVGCATVDWEHGTQVVSDDVEQALRSRGNDWWTEWGVFVNNVLVCRTGNIYPRRHTTQLPFAVACGSQNVTIDVRVLINNWDYEDSPSPPVATPFRLFSSTIWCRNHYR